MHHIAVQTLSPRPHQRTRPRRSAVWSLLLLLVLACGQAPEQAMAPSPNANPDGPPGVVRDRYVILFDREILDVNATVDRLAQRYGIGQVHYKYRALKGFSASLSARALAALRRNADVRLIEADQVVSVTGSQLAPPWGLDRIDQRPLPLSSLYGYTTTGQGVTAYIVDTGILPTHSDFESRAIAGFDAFTDGQKGIDCNGHGTHVAGTIGGRTFGVAKAVRLIGVRVLDCSGSGTVSSVLAGLDWVLEDRATQPMPAPAVVNLSLGGYLTTTALDDAVAYGVSEGITHVMAAGNSNTSACSFSPARTTSGVTVAASDGDDSRAYFSNFGSCVDLFAPGVGILSAYIGSNSATATLSGTSMASPHVTGAVALYLEANPAATPATVATALTSAATTGRVSAPGEGSPNLLLFTATGAWPTAPAAPASFTATATSSSSITLSWLAVGNAEGYQLERVDPLGSSTTSALGIDATSVTVSGLAPSATYTFRLRAYNAGGFSPTSSASATTQGSTLTTVRVGSLSPTVLVAKGGWRATVTVAVTTSPLSGGLPVAGATVSARFGSGNTVTCTTSATSNGTCQISSGSFSKKVTTTTFTVTSITGTNLRYDSSLNAVTSLTLVRPN